MFLSLQCFCLSPSLESMNKYTKIKYPIFKKTQISHSSICLLPFLGLVHCKKGIDVKVLVTCLFTRKPAWATETKSGSGVVLDLSLSLGDQNCICFSFVTCIIKCVVSKRVYLQANNTHKYARRSSLCASVAS